MSTTEDISKLLVEKKEHPAFSPGDTVSVHYRIIEGEKERIQIFQGVVLQKRGTGLTQTFTVRKISNSVGVERIFPLHSPKIDKLVVEKYGKVRRARLFYVRAQKGKNIKIKPKMFVKKNK